MGAGEIVLIFVVYLLLFGAKGIPALAQTLGKAVYQFRHAAHAVQREIMDTTTKIQREINLENVLADDEKKPKTTPASVAAPPPSPAEPKPPVTTIEESTKPNQEFS